MHNTFEDFLSKLSTRKRSSSKIVIGVFDEPFGPNNFQCCKMPSIKSMKICEFGVEYSKLSL